MAQAVVVLMQKASRSELGPKPVPLTVPGEIIDEEEVRLSNSVFSSASYVENYR